MISVYITCTHTDSLSPKAYSMNDENATDMQTIKKNNKYIYQLW
jgi:hypothetical protein